MMYQNIVLIVSNEVGWFPGMIHISEYVQIIKWVAVPCANIGYTLHNFNNFTVVPTGLRVNREQNNPVGVITEFRIVILPNYCILSFSRVLWRKKIWQNACLKTVWQLLTM